MVMGSKTNHLLVTWTDEAEIDKKRNKNPE